MAETSNDQEEIEQEDRLSMLPDHLLLNILDKLEIMHEVVRTSVLSKRWRHLTGLHSRIVLDVLHFEPDNDDGSEFTLYDLVQSNSKVIQATKSILAHTSQDTVTLLYLRFYLKEESIDIVRAVDDAMAYREFSRVEFVFKTEGPDMSCTDGDMLMYGRRFMIFFDACPLAFGALEELSIQNLTLGKSDIPNVLRTCKKLEYLSMDNCDAGIRSVLQIEHPQLTELRIGYFCFERVELIFLPRLVHLSRQTWMTSKDYPVSFGYVPQLQTLFLSNNGTTQDKIFEFSRFLDNTIINHLDLDFQCERIWIQPEGPKQLARPLQNLRILSLHNIHEECDLTWTTFFLEAAPLLEKIFLEVWDHTCDDDEEDEYQEYGELWQQIYQKRNDLLKWDSPKYFKHKNLKMLTISGFQIEGKFLRYIRRVMEAAVNLHLISLYDSAYCLRCQFRPSTRYPTTDGERDLLKMQISEWRSSPVEIEIDI